VVLFEEEQWAMTVTVADDRFVEIRVISERAV
jgi:hypothetical protein